MRRTKVPIEIPTEEDAVEMTKADVKTVLLSGFSDAFAELDICIPAISATLVAFSAIASKKILNNLFPNNDNVKESEEN